MRVKCVVNAVLREFRMKTYCEIVRIIFRVNPLAAPCGRPGARKIYNTYYITVIPRFRMMTNCTDDGAPTSQLTKPLPLRNVLAP